jgi:hypothetical protein
VSSLVHDHPASLEPVIADLRVGNLAELIGVLSYATGELTRIEVATVMTVMVRNWGIDPLVLRAIVQALLPGICGLPRRIDITDGLWGGDLETFFVDAISILWEQINQWSGSTRPDAPADLLAGVRTHLRTLQRSERRYRAHFADTPDALLSMVMGGGRTAEELLASAITEASGRTLTEADANLIYATRGLGVSVAEMYRAFGVSAVDLCKRHRSAVAQLVA